MIKSFSYFYAGEASGKVSARAPYLKGGFEVTGLPNGEYHLKSQLHMVVTPYKMS